jgi:hypothetical protein
MPNIPVPYPNGFHDIVDAGRQFGFSPILRITGEPGSTDELAAEIAEYGRVYEHLRLGLTRSVQVRDWTKRDEAIKLASLRSEVDLQFGVRSAAHGLMRAAELAQQQNRSGEAAGIALEIIRLGQAITRDGILMDYEYGIRIEGVGDDSLYQVLFQLDIHQCRKTIDALIEINRGREPLDHVLHRDRIWHENTGDWFQQIITLLNAIAFGDWHERLVHNHKETATRLLIAELALRAFQLEYGELPTRLEQLMPEFLGQLPIDPFAPDDLPLRYFRTDDRSVVYSVSFDGEDDGGQAPAREESGLLDPFGDGDLRLEDFFPADDEASGE